MTQTQTSSQIMETSCERFGWEPEGSTKGRLHLDGRPLLNAFAAVDTAGPQWSAIPGGLSFDRIVHTDKAAIHDEWFGALTCEFEGCFTIENGDAAGLAFRSDQTGALCYGALLSARKNQVEIVRLPRADSEAMHAADFVVEPRRRYHLRVACRSLDDALCMEVFVDGRKTLDYVDRQRLLFGGYFGVLCHSCRCKAESIRALNVKSENVMPDGFRMPADTNTGRQWLYLNWESDALALSGALPDQGRGEGARIEIRHAMGDPRHVWLPYVSPRPENVIADRVLRSPAIIAASERVVLALVPDMDDMLRLAEAGYRLWLDYDNAQCAATFNIGACTQEGHAFQRANTLDYKGSYLQARLFVLAGTRRHDRQNPYSLVSRWLWRKWGKCTHQEGGSQSATFEQYSRHALNWLFSQEHADIAPWQKLEVAGKHCEGPSFSVAVDPLSAPSNPEDDTTPTQVWNTAVFSTQRFANGLLRHARATQSRELEERARAATRLACLAPRDHGLFPSIFTPSPTGFGTWSNSPIRPQNIPPQAYSVVDATATARAMLDWHDITGGDKAAQQIVLDLADRLCWLQRPEGSFPGWVEPSGNPIPTPTEGLDSAVCVSLLCDLVHRVPKAEHWQHAARKALDYLARGPVEEKRWQDHSTDFSACLWAETNGAGLLGKRIARNGPYVSSAMSIFWAAEAFLAAYRAFGHNAFLDTGQACLDELSLFQQIWEPPGFPARCHGGFAFTNADSRWNSADAALFAPLFLEYYRDTGETDYFERGVAALRNSFSMMFCPQNARLHEECRRAFPQLTEQDHGLSFDCMFPNGSNSGPLPTRVGCLAGCGPAFAAAARVHDSFGDVYVDCARATAFGINACEVTLDSRTVVITQHIPVDALTVVYSQGTRQQVTPHNGIATIPLQPDSAADTPRPH